MRPRQNANPYEHYIFPGNPYEPESFVYDGVYFYVDRFVPTSKYSAIVCCELVLAKHD